MSTALQPPPPAADQSQQQQQLARLPRSLTEHIQSPDFVKQVALACPSFLTPDRLMRIAITTINRGDANLMKCTPASVGTSLIHAASMGIEPDGRHGHLIARFNGRAGKYECQFQPDYKGMVALARRSPNVHDIYAEEVCENDVCNVQQGLHRDLVHEIDIRKPRGELIGVYAVIVYAEGPPGWVWMERAKIDGIRDRSDGWKAFKDNKIKSTPWQSDYVEMAKKTALRRVLKMADLTPEIAERAAVDIEATVTPVGQNGPAEIPRPIFPGAALPDANSTEPLTPPLPGPPAGSPRRLQRPARQAKAQEVPHPTPGEAQADAQSEAGERMAATTAKDDIPLPGGELELAPAPPPPTTTVEPTPLEAFRMEHPDAEDRHLLAVLKTFKLAKDDIEKLSDVPVAGISRAREDPSTIDEEVAKLIEKEG